MNHDLFDYPEKKKQNLTNLLHILNVNQYGSFWKA
jgi:hypothetical protein